MRKILWLSLLTAVCGFSSLRADLTIVLHIDASGITYDETMMFKGGHARRIGWKGGGTIVDLTSRELFDVDPIKKTYVKSPSPIPPTSIDALTHSPILTEDGVLALKPTGKKDTISGYAAEEYTCVPPSGQKVTAWLTKAPPDYADMLKEMANFFEFAPAMDILMCNGLDGATLPGFPVRISEGGQGGTYTCTVLSISAKPIADSEFIIPADYKQVVVDPL